MHLRRTYATSALSHSPSSIADVYISWVVPKEPQPKNKVEKLENRIGA